MVYLYSLNGIVKIYIFQHNTPQIYQETLGTLIRKKNIKRIK